jgi:hypothetical protein
MNNIPQQNSPGAPDQIIFKIELPGIVPSVGAWLTWSALLTKTIRHALTKKGILDERPIPSKQRICTECPGGHVAAFGTQAVGVFSVTDWRAGVETIRAELESAHLLSLAEIGWFDRHEQIWMVAYPPGSPVRFEDVPALLLKWAEAIAERMK